MANPSQPLRICYNENLLGPSPKAVAAMSAAMEESHLYPDGLETRLTQRLVQHLDAGLNEDNLVVGNGCSDVLRMVTNALMDPGDTAVIADNSFLLYQRFVTAVGGRTIVVPMQQHTHDLDAMLDAIDANTKLVFICNPNNPTGTYVSRTAVTRFLENVPSRVTVVLDEAYIEFTDAADFPDAIELINAGYKNVITTRTFSKIYGLAGIRVGYGVGAPGVMAQVRTQRLIFNNSRLAYLGAIAALDDTEHVRKSVALAQNGRRYFQEAFNQLGYECLPSQSNFVYVLDLPVEAATLCAQLDAAGIRLRAANGDLFPNNLRITVSHHADNERVMAALTPYLT